MKTKEEILNSEEGKLTPSGYYFEKQQVIRFMQVYADQFKYDWTKGCECNPETRIGETWCCNQCGRPTSVKSPSPVSQQLTREKVMEILLIYLNDSSIDENEYEQATEAICHLSVSPDAQKEIECLKKDLAESLSFYQSIVNISLKKDKEIEELKEYAKTITHQYDVLKKITEKFKAQLTSKEADVKRAVWALEKLNTMMRDDSRTNKEPFGKNPYEILCTSKIIIEDALNSLKGNKTEQPLHSICKCKEQKQVSYNECCGDSCINIKNIEQ